MKQIHNVLFLIDELFKLPFKYSIIKIPELLQRYTFSICSVTPAALYCETQSFICTGAQVLQQNILLFIWAFIYRNRDFR